MQLASSPTLYASCSSLPNHLKKSHLSQVSDWEFLSFAFPTWVRSEKEIIKNRDPLPPFPTLRQSTHAFSTTATQLLASWSSEPDMSMPSYFSSFSTKLYLSHSAPRSRTFLLLWVVVWVTDFFHTQHRPRSPQLLALCALEVKRCCLGLVLRHSSHL